MFTPTWGREGFQFDEHIFQMGWFNHQLVYNDWHCGTLLPSKTLDKNHSSSHMDFLLSLRKRIQKLELPSWKWQALGVCI